MKRPSSLLILLICQLVLTSCALLPSARSDIDLILVAGQSNAVGYDANGAELPGATNDEKILFWWRCGDPPPDDYDSVSGGKWTHLQSQPRGNPSTNSLLPRQYGNFRYDTGFGPEIGLARTLQAREGKQLAIIKVAFSGTGLGTDWNPSDPGKNGECYRALLAETRAAIKAAREKGIFLRLRGFVWIQGESDATPQYADAYSNALTTMIGELRKDLNAPGLFVLLGVNTHFQNPFVPKIVEAQKAVAQKDGRCVYVDTDTITVANEYHFSTEGTLELGRRLAQALLALEERPKK